MLGLALLCLGAAALRDVRHEPPRLRFPPAPPVAALDSARSAVAADDFERAVPVARRALARVERESGASSLQASLALDVLVEALLTSGAVREPGTATLAQRALAIKERALTRHDPLVVQSLRNCARILEAQGDYKASLPLRVRAVESREATGTHVSAAGAVDYDGLGVAETQRGMHAPARRNFLRALDIRTRIFGPRAPCLAQGYFFLANSIANTGDLRGARRAYRCTIALSRGGDAKSQNLRADAMVNLASLLDRAGEPRTEAVDLFTAALAIRKTSGDSLRMADTANTYGAFLLRAGRHAASDSLFRWALGVRERRLGPEHPQCATIQYNIGVAAVRLGDFPQGLARYRRAVDILTPSSPNALLIASCLQAMSSIDLRLGDVDEACRAATRALELQVAARGRKHVDTAYALKQLGWCNLQARKYTEAVRLLEEAEAVFSAQLSADALDLARVRAELAEAYGKTRQTSEARALFETALPIIDKAAGPAVAAVHRRAYGDFLRALGDTAAARGQFTQAIADFEHGREDRGLVLTAALQPRARLALAGGRPQEALRDARRADDFERENFRLMSGLVSEPQALRFAAARERDVSLVMEAALAAPPDSQTAALAWDSVVRSRAIVLDEITARYRAAHASADPQVRDLMARLTRAQCRLASGAFHTPPGQTEASQSAIVQQALAEREQAEVALAQRSADFKTALSDARTGWAQVAGMLDPSAALVAYVRFTLENGAPRYAAFVTRGGRAPQLVDLGMGEAVDDDVERWRAATAAVTAAPASTPNSQPTGPPGDPGNALRRRIWDPVAPFVGTASRAYVVPDAALHLISFAALPDTGGTFLVESGPTFYYLATERELAHGAKEGAKPGAGLLALGAPDFGNPASVASGLPMLGPLPASRREVSWIGSLWRRTAAGGTATILHGTAATEAAFKRLAPGMRVLHLASHGWFLRGDMFDLEAGTRGIAGGDPVQRAAILRESASLRAGVALAGANQPVAGRDDGILTAEEICTLDLRGVETVVLSACDTGVGDVTTGEGVLGLRRAFTVAGAQTVVNSLWPVQDEATRQWMAAYYRARLQGHRDGAQACRDASLQLLQQARAQHRNPNPKDWAGFVAAGTR